MQILKFSKKMFIFLTILTFCNACSKEENKQSETNQFESKFLGLWKVKLGNTFAINDKGETIITATIKPNTFGHDLKAGGKYIGYDYVGNTSENGEWKLEDVQETPDELKATLSITTPSLKALSGELTIDPDGYQRYQISAKASEVDVLWFFSKKYEAYPYSKNWAELIFTKH